jgi:hypothetical protein
MEIKATKMKSFRDMVNEGIIDKVANWLINNINIIKKKYINYDKLYGVDGPDKVTLKLNKTQDGIVFFNIKYKDGEKLGLMIEGDKNHKKYLEYSEKGVTSFIIKTSNLSELSKNNITPVYVYILKEG